MQVVLNQVHLNKPNDISNLELLSKHLILNAIKQSLTTPDRVQIVLACDPYEYQEKTQAKDLVTLGEWLQEKGIELETPDKHRLANLVSQLYKKTYHALPRQIARQDSRGRYLKKSYGFNLDELHILEQSIKLLRTGRD